MIKLSPPPQVNAKPALQWNASMSNRRCCYKITKHKVERISTLMVVTEQGEIADTTPRLQFRMTFASV